MTKTWLKNCSDSELIAECMNTYGDLLLTLNCTHKGTKTLDKNFRDCLEEMVCRGLLIQAAADRFNS